MAKNGYDLEKPLMTCSVLFTPTRIIGTKMSVWCSVIPACP